MQTQMCSYYIKRIECSSENIDTIKQTIEQIILIQKELNLSYWTSEDYFEEAKDTDSIFLTASFEEQIIGFLVVRLTYIEKNFVRRYEEADLLNFGVAESFQKRGIGNLLFCRMLETLTERAVSTVWLEVRESNSEALKFYHKKGFHFVQTRKSFYSQPTENGLLMRIELNKESPDQ